MNARTGLKQPSLKQAKQTKHKAQHKARRNGKGDKEEEIVTHKVKGLGLLVLQKGEHLVKIYRSDPGHKIWYTTTFAGTACAQARKRSGAVTVSTQTQNLC
jgi:hypothetical protein